MEVVRQKNVATYIVFPIVDADGDLVTGAATLDSELDAFADGAAPDGFADCTNEATEIGSTGIYYLLLTQTEMNNDYIAVQVKTGTAGAKTQVILIRTMVGDPLNMTASTDATAATATAVDTIDNFLDTEIAAILAAVDTEVADIKTKTDSLTFTVANQVDANIQSINDTTVNGDGSGTPWGP